MFHSFIFFGVCQPGGQLEASLSLMCMNEHGWFTSLRTFPILLLGLEEALRRARAFAAAGADILFVEAPESEVANRGQPRERTAAFIEDLWWETWPQAEMATICSSLADTGKPLLVNCVEGTLGKKLLVQKEPGWCITIRNTHTLIPMYCHLCFYVGFTSFWHVLQIWWL